MKISHHICARKLQQTEDARIVAYRTENELTQTQFAKIVGLKQPAIARLEVGEQPPSLTTLAKLSATTRLEFRVEVSYGAVALTS